MPSGFKNIEGNKKHPNPADRCLKNKFVVVSMLRIIIIFNIRVWLLMSKISRRFYI